MFALIASRDGAAEVQLAAADSSDELKAFVTDFENMEGGHPGVLFMEGYDWSIVNRDEEGYSWIYLGSDEWEFIVH